MIRVSEIFCSLQGEGLHTGVPMAFIRLQGCNLLSGCCNYCDTIYAQDGSSGTGMSFDAILKEVVNLRPSLKSWVCVTGGEPLFQENVEDLIRMLKQYSFRIEVETNGSYKPPAWRSRVDSWVADIKCPSSGVCGISEEGWWDMTGRDQIKFVVGTEEDLEFAKREIRKHLVSLVTVLISPVIENAGSFQGDVFPKEVNWIQGPTHDWFQRVAEFCKEEQVRMSIQQHRIIWGNEKGV